MVRAKELLAVADGASYQAAARAAGRHSGDAVAHLVARFNRDGLAALVERHGGGQPKRYTQAEQERILQEVRRTPDREQDRTATWLLVTLQGALRRTPGGLPGVSTYTIWGVLHEAGFRWGKDPPLLRRCGLTKASRFGTISPAVSGAGGRWRCR